MFWSKTRGNSEAVEELVTKLATFRDLIKEIDMKVDKLEMQMRSLRSKVNKRLDPLPEEDDMQSDLKSDGFGFLRNTAHGGT